MLTSIKQLAAAGAAAAGIVGWVTAVGPAMAYAQPPRISQDNNNSTCPGGAETNYLQDPDDSNAYYVCVDGSEHEHLHCPPGTTLAMTTPPTCCETHGYCGKP